MKWYKHMPPQTVLPPEFYIWAMQQQQPKTTNRSPLRAALKEIAEFEKWQEEKKAKEKKPEAPKSWFQDVGRLQTMLVFMLTSLFLSIAFNTALLALLKSAR